MQRVDGQKLADNFIFTFMEEDIFTPSLWESAFSMFIALILGVLLCAFGVNLFRFIIEIIKSLLKK